MNSTLQPIIDTLIPLLPGWLELPESYVGLLKGATHKYIKRVPKAGGGYRYFYHVGHGGGVQMEEHFVPGASFQHEGGHYHIKSAEGGKLVIEHDETKERKTVSKSELRAMLGEHHEPAIKAHREKVAGMLAEAKANKASPKQIAKLESRAKAVGAATGREAKSANTIKDLHAFQDSIKDKIAHLEDKLGPERFKKVAAEAHAFAIAQSNAGLEGQPEQRMTASGYNGRKFYPELNKLDSQSKGQVSELASQAHAMAQGIRSAGAKQERDTQSGEGHAETSGGASRNGYKTKAHWASVSTWEVEITTPDGKTRWERVGGERPIKDAAEASKIALDQLLGAEKSPGKSETEPKGKPATSKREAKDKAPGKAKTEPKTESSRPATLQQETERQYKRIWSDYERLLSTASKSRAEQLRPQFEARARSMAEDRAKRLVQHRKDPRFHEEVASEHAFNKKEGMNDYEAKHLAELTVMDRASEQRGLRRER